MADENGAATKTEVEVNAEEAARRIAMSAIERFLTSTGPDDDNTFLMSSGVVLRVVPVAPEVFARIVRKVDMPAVPKTMIPDKDRVEENPDDPDYQKAVAIAHDARLRALVKGFYALAVEVESIPDNVPPPESDEWIRRLEFAGVNDLHPNDPTMRKLEWLELVATKSQSDIQIIFFQCVRHYGLLEKEVMDTIQFFWDRALRSIAGESVGEEPANGNRNKRAAARAARAGIRRA